MPELYFCSGFRLFPTIDMIPIKVLFVCVHNSARSQMGEAYLNYFGKGRFEAESAGLEPGIMNPRVVQVMKEDGIDISGNETKSVFDMFKRGGLYSFVVTVCDETSAEKCPIFPGVAKRFHWSFADPSSLSGAEDEKLERTREIRDEIKLKVKSWIDSLTAR
jgi:arsenate reductase